MAVPETHSSEELFECLKLFEVEESSPSSRGERPSRGFESPTVGSIGIERCSWSECTDHNILVLVCSNGYIVTRVKLAGVSAPIIKQLKWFEGRQEYILDVVLDPIGEWLVCACLSGDLYLLPILSLMTNCSPRNKFSDLDDVTIIKPIKKKASPTCIVWWESMDSKHFCITGSEVGEITFFDISGKEEVATLSVGGYVDTLMLAHQTDSFTHLLIGLRGGEWKRILLEEHYHETAGTSYSDAHASGFEVLPDDVVIKSFLDNMDYRENVQINSLPLFSELNRLSAQDWGKEHCLTSLNLQSNQLNEYTYDFEVMQNPLRTYQLVAGATGALLTEKMIFIISHDDEHNQCAFTLSVMSRQRGSVSGLQRDDNTSLNKAILQKFTVPSPGNVVGYFATTRQTHDIYDLDDSGAPPTSDLGGCIIVTATGVYQCRQIGSPEANFLELALSLKSQEEAESYGVTFKLDVCGLYKVAAERKLNERQYGQALKLFELSRYPSSYIIERFSELERVPELVQYLHQLVYDDTPGHTSVSYPAQVQNILLKCFIHECLRCHGQPDGAVLMDKFTQFITDKFLYNQPEAMDLLVRCGLKDQLFELAKTHRKLEEVLELLSQRGSLEIDPSIQSSLANRQFAEVLSRSANGLFLYQMTPLTFVRLLNAKPSIIPFHLHHLHCILPQLDLATLLRLARLFDPSHNTIRPLLIKAHSNKKRSNSTGSLLSLLSSTGGGGGGAVGGDQQTEHTPHLETYVETFLTVLVILNHRRRQKPSAQRQLLSLSPLRTAVSGSASLKSPTAVSEGSQWVRNRTVSCGLHHSALVVNGNLYTWGSTKNGKLGHGDIEEEGEAAPLRVETLTMLGIHVVSVSCGAEHTIALCQEGVFSWGSSSHGQLGHGDTVKKTRPVQIAALADKSVVSVVCGQYHSMALDDDHRVWSWGWGVHGQLGVKNVDDKSLPAHVMLLDKWQVSCIAAGYGHSAVLSSEGKVLTFGNGMYGQLGHGSTEKQTSPKVVEDLSDDTVYLLACGNFHTVVVTMDQTIYYWGKNLFRHQPSYSPKGPKEYKHSREKQKMPTGSNSLLPQKVSNVFLGDTIIQLSCGSFHSILLTSAGEVLCWGSNGNGQLGHPHTSELVQPKKVPFEFNGQKIATIAAGDEFSLVIDERGTPWTWGRTDRGQLGIAQMSPNPHSRHAHVVVKPKPIKSIEAIVMESKRTNNISPDPNELPVLELDLGWQLPDFASIGSPHTPYGRQALDSALDHLCGFYRSGAMLWKCQDWEDWESMAKIHDLEGQWSQALKWVLKALVDYNEPDEARSKALTTTHNYLEKFIDEAKDYLSPSFVHSGYELLQDLVTSWGDYNLDFSDLEQLLSSHLSPLCYPLSLLLRGDCSCHFTFNFHFSVAKEVTDLIANGHTPPEELLDSAQLFSAVPESHAPTEDIPSSSKKKLVLETSPGDCRLWYEILRNLSKDLSKNSSILLPESVVASIDTYQSRLLQRETSEVAGSNGHGEGNKISVSVSDAERRGVGEFVAFSCGHAFPLSRFHGKIILEFANRVSDLPVSIPQTLRYLQLHYKQSSYYPSGCPYCVFQYLRKIQLQLKPEVPIKPWNPN